MKIRLANIHRLLVMIGLILTFFSSACLWNEQSLSNYILCSIVVAGITVLTYLIHPVPVKLIINNRFILWVILTYIIFESYGILWLRTGEFNWDFILVSGLLQVCITIMLMTLNNKEEIINVFCQSCLIAIVIVCLYMIQKDSIRLSTITLGSSFGLELSGNRNTVATIIGIMLIPVIYIAMTAKNAKVLFWAIVVGAAGCMLLTGSKKGIIVIVIGTIMVFLNDRKVVKYLIFPFIVVLGIYAVFNIPVFYNVVGFRLKDMFATLGIGTAVTGAQSTALRSSYILMGLKSMWNHPIFGGGMNYFQYINNVRHYSHNNYIELLNDVGILGTLIYYHPFVKKIPILYRNLRSSIGTDEHSTWVFLLFFFLSKFALDYAMVSFSAMCVFNMQFILIHEILRREKVEHA